MRESKTSISFMNFMLNFGVKPSGVYSADLDKMKKHLNKPHEKMTIKESLKIALERRLKDK